MDRTRKGEGKGHTREEGEEREGEKPPKAESAKPKPRSAHAYQFGNTIIVEDEDGEVIKKYTIPAGEKGDKAQKEPTAPGQAPVRRGLNRMGTWFGMEEEGESSQAANEKKKKAQSPDEWTTDDGLRFTVAHDPEVSSHGIGHKGKRMNKQEFFQQIKGLDAKARRDLVQETDAPPPVQKVAKEAAKQKKRSRKRSKSVVSLPLLFRLLLAPFLKRTPRVWNPSRSLTARARMGLTTVVVLPTWLHLWPSSRVVVPPPLKSVVTTSALHLLSASDLAVIPTTMVLSVSHLLVSVKPPV